MPPVLALAVLGTRRLTALEVGLDRRQPLLLVAGEHIGHGKGPAIVEGGSQSGDVEEALAEPTPHHGGSGVGDVTGGVFPTIWKLEGYETSDGAQKVLRAVAASTASPPNASS